MSKLRQVLKLYCQGQFKLQISTLTGLSRNTVKKYITTFHTLRTTWEDINQLSDKELDALFCQDPEPVMDVRLERLHVRLCGISSGATPGFKRIGSFACFGITMEWAASKSAYAQ